MPLKADSGYGWLKSDPLTPLLWDRSLPLLPTTLHANSLPGNRAQQLPGQRYQARLPPSPGLSKLPRLLAESGDEEPGPGIRPAPTLLCAPE